MKKEQATQGKIIVQLEKINQKVLDKEGRLKRYRQRVKQYRQNRTFQKKKKKNERKLYQQLGGSDTKTYQQPDAKETERFWTKICQPKKNITKMLNGKQYYKIIRGTWRRPQNRNTHRLTQNNSKKNTKLENARPWWNTWLLVQEIHLRLRRTSTRNEQIPTRRYSEWMTKGKSTIIQKVLSKWTSPNNYRPITCLPMMWKTLTAKIREMIYNPLTSRRLFLDEQKGCHKGSRDTAELLYKDQHILNESKTRRKNLAISWIDYKKEYDMVPWSWILHRLKMFKIPHEVINFIEKTMKTWRVELTAGGRSLAETKMQRGIFQGD